MAMDTHDRTPAASTTPRARLAAFVTGLVLVAILPAVANYITQGPVGADVAITRFAQDTLGTAPAWPDTLTGMAKAPWVWASVALGALLAAMRGRLVLALAVPLAYGLARLADIGLRALIHSPKPDPELVTVASVSAASGLPSTFGLVFGAIFGVAMLAPGRRFEISAPGMLALAIILAGLTARLVLGGHWASQLAASALFGMSLSGLALLMVMSFSARILQRP
jgi:hypothetical protein